MGIIKILHIQVDFIFRQTRIHKIDRSTVVREKLKYNIKKLKREEILTKSGITFINTNIKFCNSMTKFPFFIHIYILLLYTNKIYYIS